MLHTKAFSIASPHFHLKSIGLCRPIALNLKPWLMSAVQALAGLRLSSAFGCCESISQSSHTVRVPMIPI